MRHTRKMSKLERKAEMTAMRKQSLAGQGLYVYENNTKGDLSLPKPTNSGKKLVAPGEQFQGDDYFMSLVKSNMLKFVREIVSPQQEQANMSCEKKLICDQPDRITNRGQVESVLPDQKPLKLNEGQPRPGRHVGPDVLITEDPMDGVEIIIN